MNKEEDMKRLIVLAIILLFAWCVSLLWAGQAGAGERSPAPPPTRAIPKAIKPPEPPGFISIGVTYEWYPSVEPVTYEWYPSVEPDCPWRIKVVPEAEAEKLMGVSPCPLKVCE